MYRHPALTPLSREHHLALQLARGIQKTASAHLRANLPPDLRALAAHVCSRFAGELEAHFAAEEKILVEALRGRDPELDALCASVVREHAEMRELARQVSLPGLSDAAIEDLLDRLGVALETHVRTEERAFYDRIQTTLDEPALLRLGVSVAQSLERRADLSAPLATGPKPAG